jgi:hypothetical protein
LAEFLNRDPERLSKITLNSLSEQPHKAYLSVAADRSGARSKRVEFSSDAPVQPGSLGALNEHLFLRDQPLAGMHFPDIGEKARSLKKRCCAVLLDFHFN